MEEKEEETLSANTCSAETGKNSEKCTVVAEATNVFEHNFKTLVPVCHSL